ncbi:MAG: Uma2 family endonuclease, partial [Kamptonema sp. SIO4C4]|nr:Uma2 family endonuclease [Kamptonema sp. SIO4C4]
NCTFRKPNVLEAQPDLSYYIGETANAIPHDTSIINLEQFPPPNLAIEIAKTSLADDQGKKRLLYEDLAVSEYWIVDVNAAQITAFRIDNGGSFRIRQSQILPNLDLALLEAALRRTCETPHNEVGAWLLEQWQS